jgi:hypothetical protein
MSKFQQFSNRELNSEYQLILSILNSNKSTYIEIENQEKGTLLVKVYVRPTDNKRKTDFIGFVANEVVSELSEEDMGICSYVITRSINGLHWKAPKKGYFKHNHLEYYIRPDWKYWYSIRKDKEYV